VILRRRGRHALAEVAAAPEDEVVGVIAAVLLVATGALDVVGAALAEVASRLSPLSLEETPSQIGGPGIVTLAGLKESLYTYVKKLAAMSMGL
jgi:hypothetical protein